MKKQVCGCGQTCALHNENEDQPCWGKLKVIDFGDDNWGHFCEGHDFENHVDNLYIPAPDDDFYWEDE